MTTKLSFSDHFEEAFLPPLRAYFGETPPLQSDETLLPIARYLNDLFHTDHSELVVRD